MWEFFNKPVSRSLDRSNVLHIISISFKNIYFKNIQCVSKVSNKIIS